MTDIIYRRKKSQPVNYTSDEDILELESNLADISFDEINLHLGMNLLSEGEEWRPIQRTEIERIVKQRENIQEAELLIQNIVWDDPFELYKLFASVTVFCYIEILIF